MEIDGKVQDNFKLAREVHPEAGNILLLNGYSEELARRVYGKSPQSNLAGTHRRFIQFSELTEFTLANLRKLAADGYDGIHLYTNLAQGTILVGEAQVRPEEFFFPLDGLGLKFIYIDTCNSVQVVSSFRRTDMRALIAATENLYVNYADEFESIFYDSLGRGDFVSLAFQKATATSGARDFFGLTRSGGYDPMFLDLKGDFRFGVDRAPVEEATEPGIAADRASRGS